MKKILHFVVLFLTISTFSAKSQISIPSLGSPYSQDFNTLASSGATSSTLPAGWAFLETGSNANTTYGVDAGSATAGNTYSYGATSNTERALGSLSSSNLQSRWGASFVNNSGSVITSLTITYVGEQWRLGATSGRLDTLNFKYSTDASSLSTGTWIDENSLDFTSPKVSGSAGSLDGNAVGNQTSISFTISGLNITSGSGFWIRWDDIDATGSDDGLAIDDFTISYNGVVTSPCNEPVAQPTALILTASPTSISGSFTAPVTTPDQYLIVRSTSSTLSSAPADVTSYTEGQSFGGGTIIAIQSGTTFTDINLTPNTAYYYFVFAYNSEDCLGGPNYLATSPLTNNSTTLALPTCSTAVASPTALNLTPSNNTILGSFTAVVSPVNYRYLIVRSTSSSLSATPVNGTTYTTGQVLGNGIVVDYTASSSFVATGLTVATQYYFYIFTVSAECNGEPFYKTTSPLTGNTTTTNTSTGAPAGYYNAANGLTCANLKTALKNIISANTTELTYTPGVWNAVNAIDKHRNDANTADIIWDIYTDNPTGAELYTFAPITKQCGSYSKEGDCYNREHSFPREWFGGNVYPMYSDLHHIFPVDGWVNGKHDSNPYGEVSNPTFTSKSNGSKLGPNVTGCYTGTVFEPINAYKGDIARAQLYMITRYQDSMVKWKNNADFVFSGNTYPSIDEWYIQLLLKWHHLDPVSQKEIDRNNAIYARQGNRNPFVDVPSFADDMFSCVTFSCIIPVKLIDFTAVKTASDISLNWSANAEVGFKNYQVERSIDGTNFYSIGNVPAQNLANYTFKDNALTAADLIVYYRLKMIDVDGRSSISKIVSVKIDRTVKATLIYPNPSTDIVTIKLLQNLKANSILKITDAIGRVIMQQNISKTQHIIPLNIQTLGIGKYFVTIKNDSELIHESFMKIK